jgi:cytochrome c oxidase subunit 3
MPTGQLFVWLLIAGITMFFAALSSAAIVRIGIDGRLLAFPPIVWANTAVLVGSSVTLGVLQWRVQRQRMLDTVALRLLWATVILGVLFLAGQVMAWGELIRRGVFLPSFPAASFFYVLTAAHGLHLLGGLVALAALAAVRSRPLTFRRRLGPTAVYWHFLTLLWGGLIAVLQLR